MDKARRLSSEESHLKSQLSERIREVLKDKKIKLFELLLQEAGSSDTTLAKTYVPGSTSPGNSQLLKCSSRTTDLLPFPLRLFGV